MRLHALEQMMMTVLLRDCPAAISRRSSSERHGCSPLMLYEYKDLASLSAAPAAAASAAATASDWAPLWEVVQLLLGHLYYIASNSTASLRLLPFSSCVVMSPELRES